MSKSRLGFSVVVWLLTSVNYSLLWAEKAFPPLRSGPVRVSRPRVFAHTPQRRGLGSPRGARGGRSARPRGARAVLGQDKESALRVLSRSSWQGRPQKPPGRSCRGRRALEPREARLPRHFFLFSPFVPLAPLGALRFTCPPRSSATPLLQTAGLGFWAACDSLLRFCSRAD